MANPTFGEKKEGVSYKTRYGVYAVIPDSAKEEIGQYYGQADEYFYSSHRDTYYYNPAYLYEATSYQETQKPLEDFNNLAWFPIEEAIENLKRGSHKWAIESWKKQHQI